MKKILGSLLRLLSGRMFVWLLLVAVLVPAVYALSVPGFYGASDDIHVAWVYEMVRVIKIGQIPPRFVPDLSYGFGYPLFNFVFPLPYVIGAVLNFAGLSLVDAVKVVFGMSILGSGILMFLLLREILGERLGFAGAVMYVYSPYRAIDVYYRGDIGESVAFVFFPMVLLGLYKLTALDGVRKKWVGVGAIGIMGLVLSHNIAAYMFLPVAVFFAGVRIVTDSKRNVRTVGKVGLTFAMGLMGTIYFWLPAIADSRLVKYDTVFSYVNNFPSVFQLFAPTLTQRQAAPDVYGGQSFYLGAATIMVVVLVAFIFFRRDIEASVKVLFGWAAIVFGVAIFMMNYRSVIVWQHIPLIAYFQFPWRFLMMTTLSAPFLLAAIPMEWRRWAAVIVVVLSVGTTFQLFKPHDFLLRTDSYYLNRYIPVPVASEAYRLTKEEYLRLPKGTEVRPEKNYPIVYTQEKIIRMVVNNPLSVSLTTKSKVPFWMNLSKYAFPGWVAEVNGKETPIEAGKPFGQVSIFVPAGVNNVKIKFGETTFKTALDWLSLGAFGLSLYFILKKEKFS